MKTSLLVRASLVCALASNLGSLVPTPALAAPAKPAASNGTKVPAGKIPREVRALMVRGAKTMETKVFPMGEKGAPILLHSWMIDRSSSTSDYVPKIFCVDLFYRDKPNAGKWHLSSSTSYIGDAPYGSITYTVRWLNSATKKGIVVIEERGDPNGVGIQLITLPDGVSPYPSGDGSGYIDRFYARSSGGGQSSSIEFGTDASGNMTVERRSRVHVSKAPEVLDTYAWRDTRWAHVASASRQIKR